MHIPHFIYSSSVDIWIISITWLLWKTLLGALVGQYLFESLPYLTLLSVYVGVGSLDHEVTLCWLFSGTATTGGTISHAQGSSFLHILTILVIVPLFLRLAILRGHYAFLCNLERTVSTSWRWGNIGTSVSPEDSGSRLRTQLCFFLAVWLWTNPPSRWQ